MLLRHRPPRLDSRPTTSTRKGFEHLDQQWIAVLRWLQANKVDFVLLGRVAEAIRGRADASGPVAIVPAPYRRNFERLARALSAAEAQMRHETGAGRQETELSPVKMTAEKLARGQRWTLRCGEHDLDIDGQVPGGSYYQELLYETTRFELAADVSVEVASPEDIEHYAQVGRTGTAPEIRITRNAHVKQDAV